MDLIPQFIDIILHLDQYLNLWIQAFGPGIYVMVFLIIFCETGLVITPFLPGDSILFTLGTMTAVDGAYLSLPLLCVLLVTAGVMGDAANYTIGRFAGAKLFSNPDSKFFRRDYLERTQLFYEKHGGKTIILARFIPIVRTFAPFVAGMAKMNYPKFFGFNVVGAASWVVLFLVAGAFFGHQPYVKNNFHLVIFAIIVISFVPVALEFVKAKRNRGASASNAN